MKAVGLLFALSLMAMFGKIGAFGAHTTRTLPLSDNSKLFRMIELVIYTYKQRSKNGSDFDYLKITKTERQVIEYIHSSEDDEEVGLLSGIFREKTNGKIKDMTCSISVLFGERGNDIIKSFECTG